jgi:hypothetical protein
VDTSDENYKTVSIDQSMALQIIRAKEVSSQRKKDSIKCERRLVIERTKSAARAQARIGIQNYKAQPSELQMLSDLEELLPGSGLLKLISTKMTNKQELRLFKKIMYQARKDKSQHGQVLINTVGSMQELADKLVKKPASSVEIDKVKEVLFYAEQ